MNENRITISKHQFKLPTAVGNKTATISNSTEESEANTEKDAEICSQIRLSENVSLLRILAATPQESWLFDPNSCDHSDESIWKIMPEKLLPLGPASGPEVGKTPVYVMNQLPSLCFGVYILCTSALPQDKCRLACNECHA
ncbi:hypothetical protein FOXG_11402 [Fusarium oxysporum f. sp. lycopersici 4287]|uniref:Uncharacterized protein n=2 Tax=Fusarium oxysporum TaxID=5507 RepID=A0A0J9VLC9_FUSO4|nr:hypothetical protein FOXG_11402 [Fusarium oxysporum f. sp. lycopersici 4287]KNB11540.1 hypothetical protein FOXG_11402 [Fusarium oxysporum f. sp. lycopersici 4287]